VSDYREYGPPTPLLLGYDPCIELPVDHLARFVEMIVEECTRPLQKSGGKGQPQYDPRLLMKVLVYAYATGVRSSRTMERLCHESLPYLFLTRGDAPSYRTLCNARLDYRADLEEVWTARTGDGEPGGNTSPWPNCSGQHEDPGQRQRRERGSQGRVRRGAG
jgi:hypothetical protein